VLLQENSGRLRACDNRPRQSWDKSTAGDGGSLAEPSWFRGKRAAGRRLANEERDEASMYYAMNSAGMAQDSQQFQTQAPMDDFYFNSEPDEAPFSATDILEVPAEMGSTAAAVQVPGNDEEGQQQTDATLLPVEAASTGPATGAEVLPAFPSEVFEALGPGAPLGEDELRTADETITKWVGILGVEDDKEEEHPQEEHPQPSTGSIQVKTLPVQQMSVVLGLPAPPPAPESSCVDAGAMPPLGGAQRLSGARRPGQRPRFRRSARIVRMCWLGECQESLNSTALLQEPPATWNPRLPGSRRRAG